MKCKVYKNNLTSDFFCPVQSLKAHSHYDLLIVSFCVPRVLNEMKVKFG